MSRKPSTPKFQTVTLMLTDVVGSTTMWRAEHAAMLKAMNRHNRIVARAVTANGGSLPVDQGEGDARLAAFTSTQQAVRCAVAIQEALEAEAWPTSEPVRVRIGVHTGEATLRDGNWFGAAVSTCARIRGESGPGEIVLSNAVAELLRGQDETVRLTDLGEQRLKDLARPERLWRLETGAAPLQPGREGSGRGGASYRPSATGGRRRPPVKLLAIGGGSLALLVVLVMVAAAMTGGDRRQTASSTRSTPAVTTPAPTAAPTSAPTPAPTAAPTPRPTGVPAAAAPKVCRGGGLYLDDFELEPVGPSFASANTTLIRWTTTRGFVDVIAPGYAEASVPSKVVDMAGARNRGGAIVSKERLTVPSDGCRHQVEVIASGCRWTRSASPIDSLEVRFGGLTLGTLTLAKATDAPFDMHPYPLSAGADGFIELISLDYDDNCGVFVDAVKVTRLAS